MSFTREQGQLLRFQELERRKQERNQLVNTLVEETASCTDVEEKLRSSILGWPDGAKHRVLLCHKVYPHRETTPRDLPKIRIALLKRLREKYLRWFPDCEIDNEPDLSWTSEQRLCIFLSLTLDCSDANPLAASE